MTQISPEAAKALAEISFALGRNMPEGMTFVLFLTTVIEGDGEVDFRSSVISNAPPETFAPVLRSWIERFDEGKTGGFGFDA